MPVGALPADSTQRCWIRYTSGIFEHELMVRFADSAVPGDYEEAMADIATAMRGAMHVGDAILGFQYAPNGSNIRVPFDGPTGNGLVTITDYVPTQLKYTQNASLTGKSADGHKVRWTFFTVIYNFDDDYRLAGAEQPTGLSGIQAQIVEAKSLGACTISGDQFFLNAYWNWSQNAHFQRKQR